MNPDTVVALVKERLGIKTAVRDSYLKAIVDGVIRELEDEQGITLKDDDAAQIIFVCDFATWRYQSRDSDKAMPRHLQFRLHNLIIHAGGAES